MPVKNDNQAPPQKKRRTLAKGPEHMVRPNVPAHGAGGLQEPAGKDGEEKLLAVKQEIPDRKELQRMTATLNYMKKNGNSAAYDEYHSKDTDGKRAWFFQVYKKDPRLTRYTSVMTVKSAFKSSKTQVDKRWLTDVQIMAENGYTDANMSQYSAIKDALLEGLESRDHENKKLAAMGIKQFLYQSAKTSDITGKQKSEKVVEEGDVDPGVAARLGRVLETCNAGMQMPPPPEPSVSIEPWKKEAMAFEKSLAAVEAKAAKVIQQASASKFKLEQVKDNKMATAHFEHIDDKLPVFMNAFSAFQREISVLDSRTSAQATHMVQVAEPAMATMKEHIVNFEKVVKMAVDFLKAC